MNNKEPKYNRFDFFGYNHKNILLAEDNEGDVEMFKIICEESSYPCSLFTVEDGEALLDFTKKFPELADIVILDINMPKISGIEALKEIKRNDQIKSVPVVMLSSSVLADDIAKSKKYEANGYIKKPLKFDISELLSFIDVSKDSPETFFEFTD